MKSRGEKMYKDSPTLERGEDGKMSKTKKKETPEDASGKAVEQDGSTHARHAMERGIMHHRHEMEHAAHDMKGGDKKELHARHIKEMTDMHKRHEKEIKE